MPAAYDAIAEWYDEFLRTQPYLFDVVIPATLGLIERAGELRDQRICDLACGQGVMARELARRGARVVAVDVSPRLLALAQAEEAREPLGITYQEDDAQIGATLAEDAFDGVLCNMALMDIPDLAAVYQTVRRILRPGGWFVFSITHPCVHAPDSAFVTRPDGQPTREMGNYFAEGFWVPANAPGVRGRVGSHHRTLTTYLNGPFQLGLRLEELAEPPGSALLITEQPAYRWLPTALLARFRKPEGSLSWGEGRMVQ
jgi:SAM-dependent methyltransferase